MSFLTAAWDVMLELAPWLLLGAAVAGVLHVLLPPGFVHRNLRGRGSVFKAVLLGVPLPLCSCGVIPAGLGLKRDGASDGASVGFLIATPQTGVDSILVSASMLGWPFALFKLGSAFVLGLVGGTLTDQVTRSQSEPEPTPVRTERATWKQGALHALEIIETIWMWIVVGVLVSAAIATFVPQEALASVADAGSVWAMLAVLALSLPLYVCATASVPVAAALVAGGFPPGAALVFLMAGPATNLATVGAVKGAFGGRALAVYLATIILGSVGLGYAFDFVLQGSATHVHEHGGSWVSLASAIVLAALLLVFAARELATRFRPAPHDAHQGELIRVGVEGLTCDGCVRKLEGALRTECDEVRVDRALGQATVSADVAETRVRELVREAGFIPR